MQPLIIIPTHVVCSLRMEFIRSKVYFELFIEKKTHKEWLIIFNVINVAFDQNWSLIPKLCTFQFPSPLKSMYVRTQKGPLILSIQLRALLNCKVQITKHKFIKNLTCCTLEENYGSCPYLVKQDILFVNTYFYSIFSCLQP